MAKQPSARSTAPGILDGELEDIKRLLMLLLYKLGASQSELGIALRKDGSGVSRMMSAEGIKSIAARSTGNDHAGV